MHSFLTGHGQLLQMRIRYHFICNVHVPKTRLILFLIRYDKIRSHDEQKDTQIEVFSKRLKIKKKTAKIGAEFYMNFDSGLG